jgi:hypothetical protein
VNAAFTPLATWLLRSALGGGLLLLLAWWLARRIRQPARRQRLAEWGVLAALVMAVLSLAPPWLALPLPVFLEDARTSLASNSAEAPAVRTAGDDGVQAFSDDEAAAPGLASHPEQFPPDLESAGEGLAGTVDASSPRPELQEPAGQEIPNIGASPETTAQRRTPIPLSVLLELVRWTSVAYLVCAGWFAGRWLVGQVGLWRLLRSASAPPAFVTRLLADLTRDSMYSPRVLRSHRIRVPVSCGLIHPTVLLPANLCESEQQARLRWILAHELTHLKRRDVWSCLLFALGGIVFFYCPWFWWLRRQARLCQEYVADAAVVEASAEPEEYAQFLLALVTVPAGPVAAVSVLGNSSDLFRRVTMLIQCPISVESRCPRPWSLAVAAGLMSAAVLASGLGLRSATAAPASPDQDKAPVPAAKKPVADEPTPAPNDPSQKDDSKKERPAKERLGVRFRERIQADDYKKDTDKERRRERFPDLQEEMEKLQKALQNLPAEVDAKEIQKHIQQALEQVQRQVQEQQGRWRRGEFFELPDDLPGGFGGASFTLHRSEGRLGIAVDKPSAALTDQLDLPKGQGLVITRVLPKSPASEVGLKVNDILLELNGKAISDKSQELVKAVRELKSKTPVKVTVLRKGKKETVQISSLPEAPADRPERGRFGDGGGFRPWIGAPGATFQGGFPAGAGGRNSVMTSVIRNDDHVTARHQEGNLVISVTGTVTDGKAKVDKIHVQDAGQSDDYTSLDQVPERYRDKVRNLIDMSEKGKVKVKVKDGAKR